MGEAGRVGGGRSESVSGRADTSLALRRLANKRRGGNHSAFIQYAPPPRTTMASETGEVSAVIDSLPYYDNDIERDPGLKDRAEKLIQKELKQQASQGLHPRVPPPPTLFAVRAHVPHLSYKSRSSPCVQNSPLLQQEMARVESHQPIPPIDTFRYQLPGPTNSPATEEDWEAALKNAQAQLEHQRLRCEQPPLILPAMPLTLR